MIEVHIYSKSNGAWVPGVKRFHSAVKALRGMYAMKRAGISIEGWVCDDPFDNDYLNRKFRG